MARFYDPPEGWHHGFPKLYQPRPNEELKETLRRDGYPAHLMDLVEYCRFWDDGENHGIQQD
jgi:hypothetical protein